MGRRKAWQQAVTRTVEMFMDAHPCKVPGSVNDLYGYAATISQRKAPSAWYHTGIINSILKNAVPLSGIQNQMTGAQTNNAMTAMPWLQAGSNAGWVHFFPNPIDNLLAYRCYICCSLAHTGDMLCFLFRNFKKMKQRIPYFKVATHDEARTRNDTIVAWFTNQNIARDWADIALESPGTWRDGVAPPGQTYWKQTVSVDIEIANSTTTLRVAQEAYDFLQQNLPFAP